LSAEERMLGFLAETRRGGLAMISEPTGRSRP
jgi:hypothetical protein